MPNYVSLTESQRRSIALYIMEAQLMAQQSQQQTLNADGSDSGQLMNPLPNSNGISCKEIVQVCKARFGLTISLSTASRLRSSAPQRIATEPLNPSAKRHRSVKFPEFEKALVSELKALEQEQIQIQQEQERLEQQRAAMGDTHPHPPPPDPSQVPPVMMLTSEAAITQVAKGIAERMGISESELGLTSGWYHGFRRRHGIKHRQFRSRGNNNNSLQTADTSSTITGNSGVGGGGGSPGRILGGVAMNATNSQDSGDDDMDDIAGDPMANLNLKENESPTLDDDASRRQFGTDLTVGSDGLSQGATLSSTGALGNDLASGTTDLGLLKERSGMSMFSLSPRDAPIGQRTEVKRITTAAACDALDVISEYCYQNANSGHTKILPWVGKIRSFLNQQLVTESGEASETLLATIASMGPLPPHLHHQAHQHHAQMHENGGMPRSGPPDLRTATPPGAQAQAQAQAHVQAVQAAHAQAQAQAQAQAAQAHAQAQANLAFAQQSFDSLEMPTSNSAAPPSTSVTSSSIPMRTPTFTLAHNVPVGTNVFAPSATNATATLTGGLGGSLASGHVPGTPVQPHPNTLSGMMMMSDLVANGAPMAPQSHHHHQQQPHAQHHHIHAPHPQHQPHPLHAHAHAHLHQHQP